MNELIHIIQREYLTRAREKSFILISLLTPLLLSLLILLPTYLAQQHEDYKDMEIGLIDRSGKLNESLHNSEFKVKLLNNQTADEMNKLITENHLTGIVYIESSDSTDTKVKYFSKRQPSVYLENKIRKTIREDLIDSRLKSFGVENANEIIAKVERSVTMETVKIGDTGKQTGPYHRTLCMALGLTIYLFVFLFSSQVMRGVLEEKSSKIIELIITSVSPIKFMAGKIIGIALLGLTQIVCWSAILYAIGLFLENFVDMTTTGQTGFLGNRFDPEEIDLMLKNLSMIDFNTIIPAFVFFFVGGYLLYSSVFAAISAASGQNDEMQQITTLISMPLIFAVIVLSNTINNPDSALSWWFSIIPFTSPVVMMGRVVYGVPLSDFLISAFSLVATVAVIIWLSGKIYKNAILYKGKKIALSEIISLVKK